MDDGVGSELQRQILGHIQQAKAQGMTISAYARGNGLQARQMHDAMRHFRKRGVLPQSSRATRRAFVAVKVSPPPAPSAVSVCRIVMGSGVTIQCTQWPPRAWLDQLSASESDAAA